MPRILTISDHIDCPTGFGVQHRHLAIGLARAGHEVHSLGLWDSRPLAVVTVGGTGDAGRGTRESVSGPPPSLSPQSAIGDRKSAISLTRYPGGEGPDDHRRAWPMYHRLLQPDLVITLGDFETFRHLNGMAGRDFAWCHWLPLDALPYPLRQHELMLRYDHLVLMSRFGLEAVRPHLEGRVPLHYVPHGVDPSVFRPLDDPHALRRRWSRRLGAELRPDDFLLIARDANQWRKQQPLLLDALARLPSDVKLLFHCHPVAHPRARGWDLLAAAREVYRVADRVIFTSPACSSSSSSSCSTPALCSSPCSAGGRPSSHAPRPFPCDEERRESYVPTRSVGTSEGSFIPLPALSPRELAELDNLADLRVSATQGEGFGVLTIEAMACGTPTLITDYATSRELIVGIADCGMRIAECQRSQAGEPPSVGPSSQSAIRNPQSEIRDPLDPFGPAGELVRVAAWTLEQERGLLRPVIDPGDLAERVMALRADRGRIARYAEAGLRRVHAHYTVGHMQRAWAALARQILGVRC